MKLMHRGGAPHKNRFTLLLLIWLALASPTHAQNSVLLTLAEAEDLALRHEPGQAALLAEAAALDERAVAAGQLPDPALRIGFANFPLQSGGFSTEGMTQVQFGLRQVFPPGKTRSVSARKLRSMASEMDRTADARGRDVLTAVRNAWLETYFWERAYIIVGDSRPYFEDLVTVTRSLYAVGKKDQQDVLRADLELSRLDDRLLEIGRQRARSRAALSEWIGTASNRPIAQSLPAWEQPPDLPSLQEQLAKHPTLLAADAKIDVQVANIDLANEDRKPGWALDFGYGYREGILPNGEPRSDFVSLSVTVDLPLFRRNRQDRTLAAALSERRAVAETREKILRKLSSELGAEYARWEELSRRLELYEQRILIQVEDQANAALAAYQSEAGDFADVMRGFIDQLNTRLEHIRLQTERAQSYVVLANLGGISR